MGYERVMFMDSDAFFSQPNMTINDFLNYAKNKGKFLDKPNRVVIGAQDVGDHWLNTGMTIWKK